MLPQVQLVMDKEVMKDMAPDQYLKLFDGRRKVLVLKDINR
jgi:hypothetical protein